MKCGFASSVRSSNQRSHNKGGGECPRLKVSAERIIFVDDDHVAVKVVGGNDGELVADPDDHRCDHQGFGEAERIEAGDLDVGEHEIGSASCRERVCQYV